MKGIKYVRVGPLCPDLNWLKGTSIPSYFPELSKTARHTFSYTGSFWPVPAAFNMAGFDGEAC